MKRTRIIRYGFLFIISFFLVLFTILFGRTNGYSESVRGVTETTIKIGAIMDLTGPIAGDTTGPLTEGMRKYTRHINDSGGISGRKLKLVVEDYRLSIPMGIATFKKLLFKDRVFAIFGPTDSGTARAIHGDIERLKVPDIALTPSQAMVVPLKRYVFLPFNLYHDQLGVIYDHILNDLKPEKLKITLVYPDIEYGKAALASTKRWAKYYNFRFDTEVLNLGCLDSVSQVMSMKRKKTSHIILQHTAVGVVSLLHDLKKFGLNMPIYGTIPSCTEDIIKMAGSASKNYTGTHGFSAWYDDAEGVRNLRKITLKYNPKAEKHNPTRFYIAGWVVSTILYGAMESAGKDITPENLVNAMERIKNLDTKGLSGPITFTPTDHKGMVYCKLLRADPETNKLKSISSWRKPPERQ